MPASLTMFSGIGPDRAERGRQMFLEASTVPAEHEQVHRDAVVVAKGRVREAIATNVAKLHLAQRQLVVRAPEPEELLRGQEELHVPGEVTRRRVHEQGGDR